ncbi:MAG: 50S ribosomal protein L22 [Gemmataceae bacterium]|nr:50S ribosomal protein L22 [Gemmata sp.]MDW8196933.1 50S ribosomal protein L22 [Gemmataceae bacterium]
MDYTAKHRYADVGPRKLRLFADLIRGKNVDEALQLLSFYPNRGAKLMKAVVQSAYGNAEYLECPDPDSLIITECRVDGAPMYKRIQPRARGTAFGILRRMSHIVVTLSDPPENDITPPARPPAAPTTPTPPAATAAPEAPPAPAPATAANTDNNPPATPSSGA